MNVATIMPPHREPNGRHKRETQAEKLNELNRIQAEQETLIVRLQPHRRDLDKPESPLAGSALGRFILKNRLREEFYDAGQQYMNIKKKWQSVVGCPSMERIPGTGADVSKELLKEWGQETLASELIMVEYGTTDGCLSVVNMAVYDKEFAPGASIRCAVLALAALAFRLGKIDKVLFESIVN